MHSFNTRDDTAIALTSVRRIKGVRSEIIKQLEQAGFKTVNDLVATGAENISKLCGLDIKSSTSIFNKAKGRLQEIEVIQTRFTKVSDLLPTQRKVERISTGSKSLDKLFGGAGIETRAITEFYGENGSGKTQICLTLSVMASQDRSNGGLNGHVLYIDTENSFRVERIKEISQTRNFDPTRTKNSITIAKAMSVREQEQVIRLAEEVIKTDKDIKLVIVDSMISNYRAEFFGRHMLPERQQRLNNSMHLLLRIAETYGVAVVVTNQVQSGSGSLYYSGDETAKAAGGHIMAHASTHRVFLRISASHRYAKLVDSPYLPDIGGAIFRLADKGVIDQEEWPEI